METDRSALGLLRELDHEGEASRLQQELAGTDAQISRIEGEMRGEGIRVRFQLIGNACIKNVGKYQSCMVSQLPIIWKQTVVLTASIDISCKASVISSTTWSGVTPDCGIMIRV